MTPRPLFPIPSRAALEADRWVADDQGRALFGADLNRVSRELRWLVNGRLALDGQEIGPALLQHIAREHADLVAGACLAAHAAAFRGSGPAADDDAADAIEYHLLRGASAELRLAVNRWLSRLARAPETTAAALASLSPRAYLRAQLHLVRARHPYAHLGPLGDAHARVACPHLSTESDHVGL